MEEESAIIVNDYGDGVYMQEYKGQYSLVATKRGKGDVNYKQWVFLSIWKNGEAVPDKQKRPMGVRLGSNPRETLQKLIDQIAPF